MLDVFIELPELTSLQHFLIMGAFLYLLVAIAVMNDLSTGVLTARAIKDPIQSRKLRRTLTKIIEYYTLITIAFLIDSGLFSMLGNYNKPWLQGLFVVITIGIEGFSIWENLKLKKSPAAQLPDLAREVIKCRNVKEAAEILERIKKLDV